jgi:hypothetical protein
MALWWLRHPLQNLTSTGRALFHQSFDYQKSFPERRIVNVKWGRWRNFVHFAHVQSRAEVRAIFLNVDKPLAEKSPRPGHSRVTAIHQNTRGLPSFEGYKVPL